MINQRQYVRNPLDKPKTLSLIVIPFEKLEKISVSAHAVDISDGGVGIYTDCALEPGFVVMRNGWKEFKSGVLLWSRPLDSNTYRAGIQYIPLPGKNAGRVFTENPMNSSTSILVDPETEQTHRLATAVFMQNTRGIMVTDAKGAVQSVNDAFVKITGYSAAETIGKIPLLFATGKQDDALLAQMRRLIQETGVWSGVYWSRRKNGELYPQETTINAIRNDRGEIVQYCSIFNDVTEKYHAEEKLRLLSSTDGLTKLANRRAFDEALETEWRRARRLEYSLAIIMADIDNFKKFNDTYGHLEGDECLKKVAESLKRGIHRAGDIAARYGGEEFILLLPMTGIHEAAKIADDLRHHIESLKIPHVHNVPDTIVTISMGVAALIPHADSFPNDLIAMADKALYKAKEAGKNRIMCMVPESSVAGMPDRI
jgi:diguanylate cyclase (GGDEF)-like protein/PAS domain S-box-containing protein